ncbi:BlaI/MecI/CopY family transcriptional regulator [Aurantivibrio infirmus]
MSKDTQTEFSRRERQIMDVIYRFEKATAREIHEAISDAPSYTSIRSHLRAMVDKGYLDYSQEGIRYVYTAVVPKTKAKSSALQNVLTNFFGGSHQDLIATLIDTEAKNLSEHDLDQLSNLIEKAKQEDR